MHGSSYHYYIDRLTILFKQDTFVIARRLSLAQLKKECRSVNLLNLPNSSQLGGYRSKLEVVVPSTAFLKLLDNQVHGYKYAITCVELAYDEVQSTLDIPTERFDTFTGHARMLNSSKALIYDADKAGSKGRLYKEKGLLGDRTLYLGARRRQLVAYLRNSKIDEKPCFHQEWRLKTAASIRRHLGINSISDLISLDVGQKFTKLTGKFIKYEEIDHEQHGRFIQDMPRGATNPGIMKSGPFTGDPLLEPERASYLSMRGKGITAPSELRAFYAKEVKRIKGKLKGKHNLTQWEARVHGLSRHRLNKFFK